MKDVSDETLVRLVLEGETHLFAKIIERYERPVYNLMFRYCRSEEEAADLSQDVFLRVYRRLSSFNGKRRFFPWLYALAVNKAKDWYKSHSNSRKKLDEFRWTLPEAGVGSDQEGVLLDQEEVDSLYEALDTLPDTTREMIMLRYREELLIFELAEIFKISESGVKMRIARGLEKMKIILGGDRHESMED